MGSGTANSGSSGVHMELQLGVIFERVLAAVQAQLDLETAQVSPGIDARLVSLKYTPRW